MVALGATLAVGAAVVVAAMVLVKTDVPGEAAAPAAQAPAQAPAQAQARAQAHKRELQLQQMQRAQQLQKLQQLKVQHQQIALLRQQEAQRQQVKAELLRKLLADPDFQLKEKAPADTPEGRLEEQVQEIGKKALWDLLAKETNEGEHSRLLALVDEVKNRLKQATPNRADLAAALDEAIDTQLLAQVLAQHSVEEWNVAPLVTFVVGRLRALESPARNGETDSWVQTFLGQQQPQGPEPQTEADKAKEPKEPKPSRLEQLRSFFDFAHRKLDLISLDTANAYLQSVAPAVAEHGADIARKQFAAKLAAGDVTLEATEAWATVALTAAREQAEAKAKAETEAKAKAQAKGEDNGEDSGEDDGEGQKEESTDVRGADVPELHRRGVAELVLPGGALKVDAALFARVAVPETMLEEREALAALAHRAKAAWVSAYVSLRLRQLVPSVTPVLVADVHAVLSAYMPSVAVETSADAKRTTVSRVSDAATAAAVASKVVDAVRMHTGAALPDVDAQALRGIVENAYLPAASEAASPDKTFELVSSRLRALLLDVVVPRQEERTRNVAKFEKTLAAMRLEFLDLALTELASGILAFARRDLAIHSDTYIPLLKPE